MTRPVYNTKYEKSWAVVIGINEYQRLPLNYARNDATVFAEHLKTKCGFSAEHVTVLLDKQATLTGIRAAIHNLARVTEPDDRVIVFYAGHGYTVPSYGREAGFLVPVDGDAEETSTLVPWDDLVHTSRMIRAKHMLFVMDACYGGLICTRALSPGASRFVRDMLGRYTRQFLTAGKADEVVADSGGPREGHSVFTGHLLDALNGGLPAPDGAISTNALMAYVADRVGKDHNSNQTPHYGYLAGDGDLFFALPKLESDPSRPKDTGDILVVVPADLLPPEEEDIDLTLPLQDQVKELLSDRKHRIKLNDLNTREMRAAKQHLAGEYFAPSGKITPQDFADRLAKYEAVMQEMMQLTVLLGRWAEGEQRDEFREIVNTIAGQIPSESGSKLWLSLRYYPMLLLMYVGGIAALAYDNYANLKLLLTPAVRSPRDDKLIAVVQATTQAMLDLNRTDAFKMLPGYETKYTPQSEYLYTRVQPIVEDILFLGNRYERLFDRFEILYALAYVDINGGHWGHPGRFAWKYTDRFANEDNPFALLVAEAAREGNKWPPLLAGMFGGSHAQFAAVAERFKTGLLDRLGWN